ncbi:MAG: hypothetical protein LBN05_07340 [Oscillospiraceae bacterium]|jgi:hypothetical protein|nr:hypothetical protein [Oscillospiraceae bacterium]
MKRFTARFLWIAVVLGLLFASCEQIVPTLPNVPAQGTPSASVDATSSITTTNPASSADTTTPTEAETPTPFGYVEYTGPRNYHVFYHFLIAYPKIAFTTSYGANLDADCVTPTEFRRSLEELYKNDFVLADLNDYYTTKADGTIVQKKLMLPAGKKPLIMSFDDLSYYEKNLGKGVCDKVIIDKATDKLAMLTVLKDGTEKITYDNDVIPMLETFCAQHPDFAPFGVKGMIALTGYGGILGYRTQSGSPNRAAEIAAAKPIVEKLRENGWYFASHGYGHIHEGQVALQTLKNDADAWAEEVAPLLGDPKIHVFPYGDHKGPGLTDARMQYLVKNKGFEVLCGVGMGPFYKPYDKYIFMDRANIDGISLRRGTYLKGVMDPKIVYCPEERGGRPITWGQ